MKAKGLKSSANSNAPKLLALHWDVISAGSQSDASLWGEIGMQKSELASVEVSALSTMFERKSATKMLATQLQHEAEAVRSSEAGGSCVSKRKSLVPKSIDMSRYAHTVHSIHHSRSCAIGAQI